MRRNNINEGVVCKKANQFVFIGVLLLAYLLEFRYSWTIKKDLFTSRREWRWWLPFRRLLRLHNPKLLYGGQFQILLIILLLLVPSSKVATVDSLPLYLLPPVLQHQFIWSCTMNHPWALTPPLSPPIFNTLYVYLNISSVTVYPQSAKPT